MEITTELTIARHCVGQMPDSGLSPLQQRLVDDPAKIRIAHAPTGAGKSYAFERAMIDRGERILFIVPTRRLCQNLAADLRDALIKEHGWDVSKAGSKIALWNSDESQRLREAGENRISTRRVREITDINDAVDGGEMVIAVPEVVSCVLLRHTPEKGLSDKGVFDILMAFDHIVFDEFHTISPRGFGLAGLFAKLASECSGARAKVSFLSATPIDIKPVLKRLEIAEDRIMEIEEKLTPEGRAVHGDVHLSFCRCDGMAPLLYYNADLIRKEREKGRQVVVIYDKLSDLQRDKPELGKICQKAGIESKKGLVIDSIDDSRSGRDDSGYFASGRQQNPELFEILIATASVEMGVTFRADLLFMEPGFEAMNFLQRYGRAARGDHDGFVFVRYDDMIVTKNSWLRQLVKWIEEHRGQTVQINEMADVLCKKTKKQFKDCPEDEKKHFGKMPNRAAYATGLYWNVLMNHFSNRGHRWKHLRTCQPTPAKTIFSLLGNVREMERDQFMGEAAKSWCDRFELETRMLRDIAKGIRVIEKNGNGDCFCATEIWLQRNTDILDRYPLLVAEDGNEEVVIPGRLPDHLLDDVQFVKATCKACFPHTQQTVLLNDDAFLIKAWCSEFCKKEGSESLVWRLYPQAMNSALKLVQLTGLVVRDDAEPLSAAGVL
ncbi:DEAD/DEAH box helicase family protein [Desulfobacter vibrioformis]|uniref:DEAD/DEAH box helicase family protein n=1 Tax=Desulfobacter vibrioformis TaxID=34031 RepID=UPI0006901161|nr:DEAD/DEAH box helicase family protein [Desulfobacter vibrioformis]